MKTILLPTDFSDNSWNAILYALEMFQSEECHFILLNTYTPVIFQWEYMQSGSAQMEVFDEMKEASNQGLSEFQEKINSEFHNPKHTFSLVSSFNTLPLEVEQMIHSHSLEMIAMGTKGASGVKRVLFGSNTIHVLKNAKCPILVIPSSYSFEKPREILFPSDFKIDFKKKELQPLMDMVTYFGSKINILHIRSKNGLTLQQETNKTKLTRYFDNGTLVFHEVHSENVPEAISEYQMKSKMDLLVMFKNKHSFFTNLFFKPTIERIGFHLNVPFLVIPTKS